MKLSVLIPMHNASQYIERCLDSLYHQNLDEQDFEVIIIDDGSIDNSVCLVEKFQKDHSNIQLIRETNTGTYPTRDKLLNFAKGSYIYCMDADDYLAYYNLGNLLQLAINYDLELLCFDTKVTKSENDFHCPEPIPPDYQLNITNGKDFIRNYPNHRVEIWWYLIKRSFLEQHSIRFGESRSNADVTFTIKLLMNSERVGYAPFEVHRYYQSSNSLMRGRDPIHIKKSLVSLYKMLNGLNTYVSDVSQEAGEQENDLIKILNKKRDIFIFYFLVRLLSSGIGSKVLKKKLDSLKQKKIYPIKNYIGPRNSGKYRILNWAINNETFIYPLALAMKYRRYLSVRKSGNNEVINDPLDITMKDETYSWPRS